MVNKYIYIVPFWNIYSRDLKCWGETFVRTPLNVGII